jgi:hypothetical protein
VHLKAAGAYVAAASRTASDERFTLLKFLGEHWAHRNDRHDSWDGPRFTGETSHHAAVTDTRCR